MNLVRYRDKANRKPAKNDSRQRRRSEKWRAVLRLMKGPSRPF